MTNRVRVVTCAGGAEWEAPLIRGLQQRELGVELVRRCVDHGELLGVAVRDRPGVAVLAADLPWLDCDLVGTLDDHGVTVVAVGAARNGTIARIGVEHRVGPDVSADELAGLLHRIDGAAPTIEAPSEPTGTVDAGSPGRLVAVWGSGGAPGRTTVATGLALDAARRGRASMLIDGDVWSGCIAQLLAVDEAPSVAQAARLAGDGWARPLATCLQPGPDGCLVLAGLARAELWPEVRVRAWSEVLDAARQVVELVIVDLAAPIEEDEELAVDRSPYRRNQLTLTTLERADDVVLVATADPIGIRRAVVAYRAVLESRPAVARRTRVVLNRVGRSARNVQDCSHQLSEWTGHPPLAFLPLEPAFDRVVWEGKPLHVVAPRSPWLRELHRLVGSLVT